jgi:hypothetical protein
MSLQKIEIREFIKFSKRINYLLENVVNFDRFYVALISTLFDEKIGEYIDEKFNDIFPRTPSLFSF